MIPVLVRPPYASSSIFQTSMDHLLCTCRERSSAAPKEEALCSELTHPDQPCSVPFLHAPVDARPLTCDRLSECVGLHELTGWSCRRTRVGGARTRKGPRRLLSPPRRFDLSASRHRPSCPLAPAALEAVPPSSTLALTRTRPSHTLAVDGDAGVPSAQSSPTATRPAPSRPPTTGLDLALASSPSRRNVAVDHFLCLVHPSAPILRNAPRPWLRYASFPLLTRLVPARRGPGQSSFRTDVTRQPKLITRLALSALFVPSLADPHSLPGLRRQSNARAVVPDGRMLQALAPGLAFATPAGRRCPRRRHAQSAGADAHSARQGRSGQGERAAPARDADRARGQGQKAGDRSRRRSQDGARGPSGCQPGVRVPWDRA
jgi:hypothetical protein